ncbi:fungal-specific transcription factor domain-containing protein [Bipolaris maydis]|nr:fungal-specific transcription factor domain-containing protein [Bipolaris maydis]
MGGSEKSNLAVSSRKTRSCAECRRRRIRCDGEQVPCAQCVYYQVPERCYYPQRQYRRVTTVKAYESLSDAYNTAQRILERLFPGLSIQYLDTLSRDELISLISPQTVIEFAQAEAAQTSDPAATEILLGFEGPRTQEFIWDERFDVANQQRQAGIDDVNGITALFDTDSGRSYLGISSVPAILHVMAYTSPHLSYAIQTKKMEANQEPTNAPLLNLPLSFSQVPCPPASQRQVTDESALIDAYFQFLHPILPMVDEADFRQCYTHGGRTDLARDPWLALLNMVLAFGYISCNDDSKAGHLHFSQRALENMNVSCFGVGHLYMLQALILFGGWYLHFLNKPNMANAVLGAAHRMALAMGLHREIPLDKIASAESHWMAGVRTRTWWCLFCLDTWAGTTLGRPPCHVPGMAGLNEASALRRGFLDYGAISMNASVTFSIIAARIQGRIAKTPLIPPAAVKQFDNELLKWHDNHHLVFRGDSEPNQDISLAALFIEYRYLNTRMLLHRPFLLVQCVKAGNVHSDLMSFANTCCCVAKQTVDTIARTWYPNQLLSWKASWFLFQACLVLLLRLQSTSISPFEANELEDYITQSMDLFTKMYPWRTALKQGQDLIQFIWSSRNKGNEAWGSSWLISDDDLVSLLGISDLTGDCS